MSLVLFPVGIDEDGGGDDEELLNSKMSGISSARLSRALSLSVMRDVNSEVDVPVPLSRAREVLLYRRRIICMGPA